MTLNGLIGAERVCDGRAVMFLWFSCDDTLLADRGGYGCGTYIFGEWR